MKTIIAIIALTLASFAMAEKKPKTAKAIPLTPKQQQLFNHYKPAMLNCSNQIATIEKKIEPIQKKNIQEREIFEAKRRAGQISHKDEQAFISRSNATGDQIEAMKKQISAIEVKLVEMKQRIENAK